jgi:hypothetical protein
VNGKLGFSANFIEDNAHVAVFRRRLGTDLADEPPHVQAGSSKSVILYKAQDPGDRDPGDGAQNRDQNHKLQ